MRRALEMMFYNRRRREQEKFKARLIRGYRTSTADRLAYQVEKFNETWAEAVENVAFYRDWKVKHCLPERIETIDALNDWPLLEKTEIQSKPELFVRETNRPFSRTVTGGGTGEPLHFGVFNGEVDWITTSKWIGWYAYGFSPVTRRYLIWGHTHFYGTGAKRWIKASKRAAMDWLVNTRRSNAIDLSPETLRAVLEDLIRYRPKVVIAYSLTLLMACRACPDLAQKCRDLKLKGIMCTAGPLSAVERAFLEGFWGCPVGMEYGTMECGVMGHTNPDDGIYHTYWDTHLLQANRDESGLDQAIVTRLTPCYLPLIRYRVGDYLIGVKTDQGSVMSYEHVQGRESDLIRLPSGKIAHQQGFIVTVENNRKMLGYQIAMKPDDVVEFRILSSAPLDDADRREALEKLHTLSPVLKNIDVRIVEVTELKRSPAGKVIFLLDETNSMNIS